MTAQVWLEHQLCHARVWRFCEDLKVEPELNLKFWSLQLIILPLPSQAQNPLKRFQSFTLSSISLITSYVDHYQPWPWAAIPQDAP